MTIQNKYEEGFGWWELALLMLATLIPLWLHFESKSWTGVSSAPILFLCVFAGGVLMCTCIALSMLVRWYGHRERQPHNDLAPDLWRDDLF